MCGLAGWAGVPLSVRRDLTEVLGWGIDDRGGHAAGFISQVVIEGNPVHQVGRKLGHWAMSKPKFVNRAASGSAVVMHSRFATCGSKDAITNAHPFTIEREGRTIYGAHNGMVPDADVVAKAKGRKFTVDSRELFELLADDDHETIGNLPGYGVLTWCESGVPGVFMVKMSEHAELEVVRLKQGGMVWASTWKILTEALELVDLKYKTYWNLEVGRVYQVTTEGIFHTNKPDVRLADRWNAYGSWVGMAANAWEKEFDRAYGKDKSDDEYDRLIKDYMKEEEEERKQQLQEDQARADRVRANWDELARDPHGVDSGT